MSAPERELGIIESVFLGTEDHGILTCWLTFDFGGTGQGFGGYCLDTYNAKTKEREGWAGGADYILGILNAVGVSKWDDIKGKEMWVERDESRIVAIEAPKYRKNAGRFDARKWQTKWKQANESPTGQSK